MQPAHKKHAYIFDMDGLLIDSEPFWHEAEIAVLRPLGVPMTHEMALETVGTRLMDAIAIWRRRFPWDGPDDASVAEAILSRVSAAIKSKGAALPGAIDLIHALAAQNAPIAIASSSDPDMIDIVLEKLGLSALIPHRLSASALPLGKPHPEIFLNAAAALGLAPNECTVFEDSIAGIIAAKSAGMRAIAVPSAAQINDARYAIADQILPSLENFDTNIAISIVRDPADLRDCMAIRRAVFIDGQNVPEEIEQDGQEHLCSHLIARKNGQAIATLRLLPMDGYLKVQRVATLANFQNQGIGAKLMRAAHALAPKIGFDTLKLGAQISALPFYERLGYQAYGEPYVEANIDHRHMQLTI